MGINYEDLLQPSYRYKGVLLKGLEPRTITIMHTPEGSSILEERVDKIDFDQYITSRKEEHGGVKLRFAFPNGYGASVIRHYGSFGFEDGLWEMAVLHDDSLCYDTRITSDVIGRMTDSEVSDALSEIFDLQPLKIIRED